MARILFKPYRVSGTTDPKVAGLEKGELVINQDNGDIYYKHHVTGELLDPHSVLRATMATNLQTSRTELATVQSQLQGVDAGLRTDLTTTTDDLAALVTALNTQLQSDTTKIGAVAL